MAAAQTKKAVGKRIRRAGEALELIKRCERAKRCGVPLGSLRDIERGRSGPGMGAIQKIAKGYGVSSDWILGL